MSQYPPPYPPQQQPQYYGQPPPSPEDLIRPAKRSGVLMIVLGVLFVCGGLCYAFMTMMLNSTQFIGTPEGRELQQRMSELEGQAGVSLHTAFIVFGAVLLAIGALLGALGVYVRGGRRGAVYASLAVNIVLVLVLGLFVLISVAGAATMGMPPAQMASALCVFGVPLLLLGLLLVWLVQAAKAAPQLEFARQQLQNQAWQHQQYQQAYQQPYQPPYPPSPPPAPAPPPGAPPAAPPGAPPSGPTPGGYHQYPFPPQTPAPPPSPPHGTTDHTSPSGGTNGPPAQG